MKKEISNQVVVSKGERTKRLIIESATELFYKSGFYRATLAQVAKAAGITQTAIYNHFESLESLLTEASLHWLTVAREDVTEMTDTSLFAVGTMKSLVAANFKYTSKHLSRDALLLGVMFQAINSKRALEIFRSVKNGGTARIAEILDVGNRDGSWKINDVTDIANQIHSLLLGELIKLLIEPREISVERRTQRTLRGIAKLVGIDSFA